MDKIRIIGGNRLCGSVTISGAKNAALPLFTTTLLTDKPITFKSVPNLADIHSMVHLLEQHGTQVDLSFPEVTLTTSSLLSHTAPYDIVRKMRASILVLGPLVARHGEALVSLPGGCAIGTRPVDIHLMAMKKLGVVVTLENGYIHAKAPLGGLVGADIIIPIVSVGATENALMAATLAKGTTRIINAACEPEIVDLAKCLRNMGAQIEGDGTNTITIEGVSSLHGTTHTILPDRIETGTYAMIAGLMHSDLTLKNTSVDLIPSVITVLEKAGFIFTPTSNGFRVHAGEIHGVDIMTEPFPGFPTDLQAQFMTLMTQAKGASMITETIFENRFMHVPELSRMGSNITVHGPTALVRGGNPLKGAPVMATDLRASVSLVMAALCADGETIINRVYHLDRGYESVENKLKACGAVIERISDDKEVQQAA